MLKSALGLALVALALLASDSCGDEIDLHLRASWGGGAATAWRGTLSLSAGSLSLENVLGLEADAAGATVQVDAKSVRVVPRTARTYDGIDLHVQAQRDATLKLQFVSSTNEKSPATFEVPIAQLIAGRFTRELDASSNRFALQRIVGDTLRFESERDHLVFSGGEKFGGAVRPHLVDPALGIGVAAKCTMRLMSAATKAAVWQQEADVALDETGSAGSIAIELPMPMEEGMYDLVLELNSKRFGAPLIRTKPIAERQVQLVVVRPNRQQTVARDWTTVGEFDPAHPKLWDRLLRLPTMKMVPGISKGPLGNEPTGSQEHLGIFWSTLKPGGWQAYPLPIAEVGQPHLLEIEFPSHLQQALSISLIEPNAAGLVTPLGLDSGIDVTPVAGRTPETFIHRLPFWPRTKSPLLLLANRHAQGPATFGKVHVLAGPPTLASSINAGDSHDHLDQRISAVYFDKPLFPENFSVGDSLDAKSGRPIDDWAVFLQGTSRLADYLRFSGRNTAVVSVVCEGSALYPSQSLLPTPKYDMGPFAASGCDPCRKDVLELMLRVFDRERLAFIPAIQFASPLPELEQILATQTTDETEGIILVGIDQQPWLNTNAARRGLAPHYNVLDPRVQQSMRRVIIELAERYKGHAALDGLAIQLSGDGYAQLPDDACALDEVTLTRFAAERNLRLPPNEGKQSTARWEWIQREARQEWLDWRSDKIAKFYADVRKDLSAVRPELKLLLCPIEPLQSRRSLQHAAPSLPAQDRIMPGLLNAGLDLDRLSRIPGVTVTHPRFVETSISAGADPIRSQWQDSSALDQINKSAAGPAVLQLSEGLPLRLEAFDKVSPFGSQNTHLFLLSQLCQAGPLARKRFAQSLAAADAHLLLDGGQMLSLGQEDAERDFLLTLREIPAAPFKTVPPQEADARVQPVVLRRWSNGDSSWFYLVNESPWPVIVDVELEAANGLNLQTVGPKGKQQRIASSAGGANWKVRLEAYDLVAARITTPEVQVRNWRTQVERSVDATLLDQIRDVRLRANLLRNPAPLPVLNNDSFEKPAGSEPGAIPSWSTATGSGMTVELDHRTSKRGGSSLHLSSRSSMNAEATPVLWVRSEEIPTPSSGRLAVWVWLKVADAKRQPKFRLAIEGRLDGQPYYRRANVGASEDGRTTQPLQHEWSPFLFPIDDLPTRGLTNLQVGFDLMGEGEVWIDDVQLFDLWFQEIERDSLLKSIALADFQVQEGKVSDSLHFLDSYWPQFVRRHVSLEDTRLAALPERSSQGATMPAEGSAATLPSSETKRNGRSSGMWRWVPRMPFQK